MGEQVYFIADLHFGHAEILNYEKRPFSGIEEMDECMITLWNETVKPEDQIFILGDFSLYPPEKTKELTKQLNGRKFLVLGNHDEFTQQFYLEAGFEAVSRYPVIFESFYMLSHEPLYLNVHMPYANLFGHVHSNPIYADYTAQSFCTCVERIGYRPVPFEEIQQKMKKKASEQTI